MQVGVRELKAKLSEYLGRAAAGETITVTDRGTPVARLVGLEDSTFQRGVEDGWIEPARRAELTTASTRYAAVSSVVDVLDDDRSD